MNWLAALAFLGVGAGLVAFAGLFIYLENRFEVPAWMWVAGAWVIAAFVFGALV